MCENCNNYAQEIKNLQHTVNTTRSKLEEQRNMVNQLAASNNRLLKQIDQGVRHITNLEEELRMYKNKPKQKLIEVIKEWTR